MTVWIRSEVLNRVLVISLPSRKVAPAGVKPVTPGSLGVTEIRVTIAFAVGVLISMSVISPLHRLGTILVKENTGFGLTSTTVVCRTGSTHQKTIS